MSLLRDEKTPSFKVDRKQNIWYDHGIGKGGNFVDFGILFHNCSVKEFLQNLEEKKSLFLSFHQPLLPIENRNNTEHNKVQILSTGPLKNWKLSYYVQSKNIPFELACRYVQEVSFSINHKHYSLLGFPHNSGGYELRNQYFKGSAAPKDASIISQGASGIKVFEGFFSFLSYLTLMKKDFVKMIPKEPAVQSNFLILNSLSFLEKSRSLLEDHAVIDLYLDRDSAGLEAIKKACGNQFYKEIFKCSFNV